MDTEFIEQKLYVRNKYIILCIHSLDTTKE